MQNCFSLLHYWVVYNHVYHNLSLGCYIKPDESKPLSPTLRSVYSFVCCHSI